MSGRSAERSTTSGSTCSPPASSRMTTRPTKLTQPFLRAARVLRRLALRQDMAPPEAQHPHGFRGTRRDAAELVSVQSPATAETVSPAAAHTSNQSIRPNRVTLPVRPATEPEKRAPTAPECHHRPAGAGRSRTPRASLLMPEIVAGGWEAGKPSALRHDWPSASVRKPTEVQATIVGARTESGYRPHCPEPAIRRRTLPRRGHQEPRFWREPRDAPALRIPDFPERAVCRQRWTVRLGEVEPVFGQTGVTGHYGSDCP